MKQKKMRIVMLILFFSFIGAGCITIEIPDQNQNVIIPTAIVVPTAIVAPTAIVSTPTMADFEKIAFESNRDGNFEIYVMNADGSNVQRLTNNPADDGYHAWSSSRK
jgi:hypothetical protein